MNNKSRCEKGREGEDLAVSYLKTRGYRILERNFRSRRGEIDIVAQDGQSLVFVEVKMRTGPSFGDPEEAVGREKQKKILQVSLQYLQSRHVPDIPVRYDVVALERTSSGYDIRLIKDAFTVEMR